MKKPNYKLLGRSIVYDALGMATAVIPVIGPFLDILWAPYAAKKMTEMYRGNKGKLAAVIVFLEELLPFTDFIPTFTIMWLYTFIFERVSDEQLQTIEVNVNE